MANSRSVEEERRVFGLAAYHTIGEPLFDIHKSRANGKIASPDPDGLIGEIPDSGIPVQIVLDKGEIDPPSPRLQTIQEAARRDKKRVVITALIATGGVLAVIGASWAVKHFIDINPHSDITDK